jgi:hypothetical protein
MVWALLRPVTGNWNAASTSTAVFFFVCQVYSPIGEWLRPYVPLRTAAAMFVAVALLAAVAFGRRARAPFPAIALAVVIVALAWRVAAPVWDSALVAANDSLERPEDATAPFREPRAQFPDVYYIIADGLTRPDVLQSKFGVDVSSIVHRFRSAGMSVPGRSRSNYAQTYLSMASSLNGEYIDPAIAASWGPTDRRPLDRLVQRAEMIRRFRRAGYEFVMVGSDSTISAHHPLADRCVCPLPSGPTELESVLLAATPFGDLLDADDAAQRGHWNHVTRSFASVEAIRSDRPLLLFAHFMVPHPPFVFSRTGAYAPLLSTLDLSDGDAFPGGPVEYRRGYAAQAAYTLDRLALLVERLMARPRRPVIVIHGDHGSGLGMVHDSFERTDWEERFAIFSAYGGPDRVRPPPDDITPVNALRWAYGEATQSPWAARANRSLASTYGRPYELVDIQFASQ